MNVKTIVISILISLTIGLGLGCFCTYAYIDSINSRQLADADRVIGERDNRIAELESDNRGLTTTKDGLIENNRQLQNLNERAKSEINIIGRTIDSISIKGKNISQQLQIIIGFLKEIEARIRVLENLYNSSRINSGS
jgi:hypothetical protein